MQSKSSPLVSPLISDEKLKSMYAAMLRSRALEQHLRRLVKQGRCCPDLLSKGRWEASEVGCVIDLRPGDSIVSEGRDFILEFIRRASLDPAAALLAGVSAPPPVPASNNGSLPSVAGSTDAFGKAVHLARANKSKRRSQVVVAFATSSPECMGSWQSAFERAGTQSLSILFVAQRAARMQGQDVQDLSSITASHGFPGIPVDGSDVVAVYRVAHESLARARRGCGPALIICTSYDRNLFLPHSNSGNAGTSSSSLRNGFARAAHTKLARSLKRPRATLPSRSPSGAGKIANEPIRSMEEHLSRRGLFTPAWKRQILSSITREMDEVFAAKASS